MTIDDEIEAFVLQSPRSMTYSELEAAIFERFGTHTGWTRERIARFWRTRVPARPGVTSRLELDADVRHFVDDRLDRLTFDELRDACVAAFGQSRSPSRSALHRYALRQRKLA